jgi:hypothetical protein
MRITKQKSLVHGAQHPYVSSTSYQESKVEKYTNAVFGCTESSHGIGIWSKFIKFSCLGGLRIEAQK